MKSSLLSMLNTMHNFLSLHETELLMIYIMSLSCSYGMQRMAINRWIQQTSYILWEVWRLWRYLSMWGSRTCTVGKPEGKPFVQNKGKENHSIRQGFVDQAFFIMEAKLTIWKNVWMEKLLVDFQILRFGHFNIAWFCLTLKVSTLQFTTTY